MSHFNAANSTTTTHSPLNNPTPFYPSPQSLSAGFIVLILWCFYVSYVLFFVPLQWKRLIVVTKTKKKNNFFLNTRMRRWVQLRSSSRYGWRIGVRGRMGGGGEGGALSSSSLGIRNARTRWVDTDGQVCVSTGSLAPPSEAHCLGLIVDTGRITRSTTNRRSEFGYYY